MSLATTLSTARGIAILWTVITVGVVIWLTNLGQRRKWYAVVVGKDGRLSTSKAVAASWTVLVVYILFALITAWPSDWDKALANLSPTYLLLLGGPYSSLVLAKLATSTRVASGTLSKPTNNGSIRLADLVSDDSGDPDLFDMQFVIFNIVAIVFAVEAFRRASVSAGFPEVPDGLLLLTGGPAAVYVTNKFFAGSSPTIDGLSHNDAQPGQVVVIRGRNLLPTGDGRIVVWLGGVEVPATSLGANGIQFVVPALAEELLAVELPVSVHISGLVVDAGTMIRISPPPPKLAGPDRSSVTAGDTVTLLGHWSVTGPAPVVVIDGSVAVAAQPGFTATSLTFVMPHLADPLPRVVPIKVRVRGVDSNEVLITADK